MTSWRTDVFWFFKKLKATNQLFKIFSFFFYYYFTKNLQWTKIQQKNLQHLLQKDHPHHPDHRQQLQQDVRKILASKTTKTICFYVEFAASTSIMNAVGVPAYHVQFLLTNKRILKNFTCGKCTEVPEDLAVRFKKAKEDHTIRGLKKEVDTCNEMIKQQDEMIQTLNTKISKLKEKNINKHTVTHLTEKIEETMKEIGASFKEAIVNHVANSTNKIEDQIKTSYANAVSRSSEISSVELKSVVTEARFAEQKEEIDRKNRTNNLIIHGVQESQNSDENKDKEFVNNLVKRVKAAVTIKEVFRIGQPGDTERNRPIKVVLKSDKEKFALLGNLFALKGVEEYNGISITEDLTQAERRQYKLLSEEAKDKNNQLSQEDSFIWRVRGNSKNGYRLVRLNKHR